MSSKSYEYLVPICVFGEASVGKSSIILRFREGSFDEGTANPTIGVEFSDKVINIDGTNIKIQMWDTTGDPRFRSTVKQYFQCKAACFLVFDLTNKKTFDDIANWIHDLKDLTHPQAKIILVGNKADLEAQRKVSKEQAEAFAAEHELTYFETSCKTGQNIEACFHNLGAQLLNSIREGTMTVGDPKFGIRDQTRNYLNTAPGSQMFDLSVTLSTKGPTQMKQAKKGCCSSG